MKLDREMPNLIFIFSKKIMIYYNAMVSKKSVRVTIGNFAS
jgi:hypothetical protein